MGAGLFPSSRARVAARPPGRAHRCGVRRTGCRCAGRRGRPAAADGVVADHEGGVAVRAEVSAGFEEQLRVGFLAAQLVGDDAGVDQGVQPVVGEVGAQVPGEVADDADAQSAFTRCAQDGFGVGVGDRGVRGGEFRTRSRATAHTHLGSRAGMRRAPMNRTRNAVSSSLAAWRPVRRDGQAGVSAVAVRIARPRMWRAMVKPRKAGVESAGMAMFSTSRACTTKT